MKVSDILNRDEDSNQVKAIRIVNKAKCKAKKANPENDDTVSGWRGDPHQGSHVSTTWLKR